MVHKFTGTLIHKIKKDGSTAISKRVMLMKNKDDKADFKLLLIVSISVGVLLLIMYIFFQIHNLFSFVLIV